MVSPDTGLVSLSDVSGNVSKIDHLILKQNSKFFLCFTNNKEALHKLAVKSFFVSFVALEVSLKLFQEKSTLCCMIEVLVIQNRVHWPEIERFQGKRFLHLILRLKSCFKFKSKVCVWSKLSKQNCPLYKQKYMHGK